VEGLRGEDLSAYVSNRHARSDNFISELITVWNSDKYLDVGQRDAWIEVSTSVAGGVKAFIHNRQRGTGRINKRPGSLDSESRPPKASSSGMTCRRQCDFLALGGVPSGATVFLRETFQN